MELETRRKIAWAGLTFIGFVSALPILGEVLSVAAWSGVNAAIVLYLVLACVGALGLLIGVAGAFSRRELFVWITGSSAASIVALTMVLLSTFLFGRAHTVSLNARMSVGPVHGPILAFYAFAVLACAAVASVASRKVRERRGL